MTDAEKIAALVRYRLERAAVERLLAHAREFVATVRAHLEPDRRP